MGYGDELMATAQARERQLRDPHGRKVRVVGRDRQARWSEVFEGNPRIARPGVTGDTTHVVNGPNARPYIAEKTPERWTWKPWACEPGELYFSRFETEFAARHAPGIVIEPTLKAKASPNKAWGVERWDAFVALARARGHDLVQLGPPGIVPLEGVRHIQTPGFRRAAAVLARARAFVGHEGGLHHAAAAVGVPAVVIFGGYISPAQTGYAGHRNLFVGDAPCGNRKPCAHCAAAMAAITPDRVLHALEDLLETAPRHLAA